MAPGALNGLKVLDCTHVIAGAYCSLLLADLGAEVIKIEPLGGEVTRGRGDSAFRPYDFVNRNKRAIAVDTTREEGAAVVRRLAEDADIFVENYRPGALDRVGLGYADLAKVNPRLIYASISGFGHTGPYRDNGGLDLVAQAVSGIMSITGEIGSDRPMSAGVPLSDLNAGTFCAVGVLAALNHRHATGLGQHVETSLLEAAMAYTLWETGMALTLGLAVERAGTRHRLAAPYEALQTRDGWLVVGVNNQKLWRRFCEAIGEPALADEPTFALPHDRLGNRDILAKRLEAILAHDDTATWVQRINAAGVPCGPINTIADALADPHVAARGFLAEVEGRRFPRAPLTMSETPVAIRRGPAGVGEDTAEVLRAAGYDEAVIKDLAAQGVIAL